MTEGPRSREPATRAEKTFAVVTAVLLLVVGGLVALVSIFPLSMASGTCGGSKDGIICTTTGQLVVFWMPPTALVVGAAMGFLAARRSRSPMYWAGAGWCVFIVVLLAAYLIAM